MQFGNLIVNKNRVIDMILDSKVVLGFVVSSQSAIDILFFVSAFLAANKIITIAREFNGLGLGAIIQLYIWRLARLVPVYWFVFFFGWVIVWWLQPAYNRTLLWSNND